MIKRRLKSKLRLAARHRAALALAAWLALPAWAQAPDPLALQTVVVSATRHAMALLDAPAVMSVVTPQQIEERGADNLFEALRGETGLSLIGRTISGRRNISLRGMDGRHTLFLVDGKRIGNSDGLIGHSDFQYDWVAVEEIERVEVVRGPMSVLYGAEALGGVVNVITRKPGSTWHLRTLAEGSWADGGYGGEGQRAAANASGPLVPGLQLAATLSEGRRAEILSKADARIGDIEGRHKLDAALRLSWQAAPGQQVDLEHRQGREERWAGMRERSGQRRFFQSLTAVDRRHSALSWQADWAGAAALRSSLRAYGSRIEMNNERTQGVAGLRPNTLDDRVLDGQLSAEPLRGTLFTAGGEWRDERLANNGLPGGNGQADHQALFGQGEFEFTKAITLTAGLRADRHEPAGPPQGRISECTARRCPSERFGHEWSPRLYLVTKPASGWVVKGGYGHGFKPPTLKQITASYQEDEGPNTYFGNAALRPERNDALELSVAWDSTALGAQASVFYNRVSDLIVPVLFATTAGRGQYLFNNVERARLQGLELSSRAALPAGFSVQANATYLDATDGSGQRLEKRPRTVVGLEGGWQQGPWRAGLRAERHSGQVIASTVVGQPAQPLPGLTRASAHTAWRLDEHLELMIGVDNLTQLRLADESALFTWAEVPRTWRLALRGSW